jgi:hypothetical protein
VEYTEGPQEAEGAPRPILEREIGLCWIDLKQIWEKIEASPRPSTPVTSIHKINFKPVNSIVFDEHGDVLEDTEESAEVSFNLMFSASVVAFCSHHSPLVMLLGSLGRLWSLN